MHEDKIVTNASDQDIDFDMNEKQPEVDSENQDYSGVPEEKEEEISREDLKPLSEQEKQPKLQDEERIREMNRRTAIDD
jgi:hypothetical protein